LKKWVRVSVVANSGIVHHITTAAEKVRFVTEGAWAPFNLIDHQTAAGI